ncbi:interferon-induced protein with tetratricopeptide repeats 1-like isoform X1 [Scyliorhinus canicula]|uniref:interferon-induced protein with tetratricopeptide repeats 1-like isoform X1 n=2 Tax=Scyliorhinus canicula TaxID=7830 RepID=UPI0018F51DA0|nr:interferon-induced protein with tetratricopeptide repeats 1-like isoform X1 [Scyliorhinus canicula]
MGNAQEDLLKVKLDWLQCHFTWIPQRENSDLNDLRQRLQDSIDFGVKYKARSYNHLAFVNCLQGICEGAIQNLKEAEKFLRENHEDEFDKRIIVTYGNYAWVYYHMGQLTEAQSYLDKLERICQQFPEASRYSALIPEVYGEKGWSLLNCNSQDYEDAMECFKKALVEEPDNTDWNVGYATVLSRLEQFSGTAQNQGPSESVRQWRRVLELDPDDSVAMVLLALKLRFHQNGEILNSVDGMELVEKALQKSPDLPYVLRYAARFYREAGDVEKAMELLKRGLEITPHSNFLHHQLGRCYRVKFDQLTKFPAQGPRNAALQQKAQLMKLCKYHFQKATENRQYTSVKLHLDLADIYSLNGEHRKAKEVYSHLLTLEDIRPENKQAICLQAGLFELNHMKSESNAITHFLKGIKVNYDSIQQKRCRENLETIAIRWRRRNPRESKALGVFGFLHQLDGERCEAIKYFEKALESDPDNEEYLSALCELRLSIKADNDIPN